MALDAVWHDKLTGGEARRGEGDGVTLGGKMYCYLRQRKGKERKGERRK